MVGLPLSSSPDGQAGLTQQYGARPGNSEWKAALGRGVVVGGFPFPFSQLWG